MVRTVPRGAAGGGPRRRLVLCLLRRRPIRCGLDRGRPLRGSLLCRLLLGRALARWPVVRPPSAPPLAAPRREPPACVSLLHVAPRPALQRRPDRRSAAPGRPVRVSRLRSRASVLTAAIGRFIVDPTCRERRNGGPARTDWEGPLRPGGPHCSQDLRGTSCAAMVPPRSRRPSPGRPVQRARGERAARHVQGRTAGDANLTRHAEWGTNETGATPWLVMRAAPASRAARSSDHGTTWCPECPVARNREDYLQKWGVAPRVLPRIVVADQ